MRIECNITQKCNAVCWGCNKAVGLADGILPSMTVAQIHKAVNQLLEQNLVVKRFTFCGGEPIMHPDLQDMIYEVDRLPSLRVGRVLTNGLPGTEEKRSKIHLPPRFKWIVNPLDDPTDPLSGKNDPTKRGNKRTHSPFWISPADVGMPSDFGHCTVRSWCGAGLDSSGWSMCGKAVMFGKLLGIDPTMRDGDIDEHIHTPINDICKHCQYGLHGERSRPKRGMPLQNEYAKDIQDRYNAGELPDVSKTFESAFKQFHETGPLIQLQEM